MRTLSEQIRIFLEESGTSAAALAKVSGVCAVHISRVKNGRRKDMGSARADALRAAMRRLDVEAAAKALEDTDEQGKGSR